MFDSVVSHRARKSSENADDAIILCFFEYQMIDTFPINIRNPKCDLFVTIFYAWIVSTNMLSMTLLPLGLGEFVGIVSLYTW